MRWIFLDRIVSCDPGRELVGVKAFTRSEPFFADHFPEQPVVPGVLQVEMIAQAGGRCLSIAQPDKIGLLGAIRSAKFHRPIEPGCLCRITARLTQVRPSYAIVEGEIEVDGQRMSQVEILLAILPRQGFATARDPVTEKWKAEQAKLAETPVPAEGGAS